MKKKLVVTLLTLALGMTGCSSAPSNVAQSTEAPASTEAVTSTELAIPEDAVVIAPVENDTEVSAENGLATETEAATEVTEETETAETEFAVVAMEATKYAKKSVNVRKGPSTDYEKVGSLSTNQKVKVIGQADTGWYQIELDGEIAYVSEKYLVDEKVAVNTTPGENGATDSGNTATTPSGSENVNTTPTPDEGSGDVASGGNDTGTNEDDWDLSDWDDFTGGGIGTGTPTTDGYGPGVEIEISPTP